MAIDSRRPGPGAVIHSDRGVRFGSWAFTDRARASGLVPSMGSIADGFDNAMIESFWSRMQVELLNRRRWRTRIELANAIFEYLEIWHNRRRRHSALGWRTRGIPKSPDTPGRFIPWSPPRPVVAAERWRDQDQPKESPQQRR